MAAKTLVVAVILFSDAALGRDCGIGPALVGQWEQVKPVRNGCRPPNNSNDPSLITITPNPLEGRCAWEVKVQITPEFWIQCTAWFKRSTDYDSAIFTSVCSTSYPESYIYHSEHNAVLTNRLLHIQSKIITINDKAGGPIEEKAQPYHWLYRSCEE
jgi:hypothetical protein